MLQPYALGIRRSAPQQPETTGGLKGRERTVVAPPSPYATRSGWTVTRFCLDPHWGLRRLGVPTLVRATVVREV